MATDKSEFRQLLQRYQEGLCTPAEVQRIEAWYHHLGAEQPFNLSPTEKEALLATVWQRIGRHTAAGTAPRAALPGGWPSWPASVRWAAAAALVLGAGLVGLQLTHAPAKWTALAPPASTKPAGWQVYVNTSAYETHLALPDGSAVTLAPASTLKYRRALRSGRREAYLTGAAFFDVFHDKRHPFSVFTDKVVTTVLGTSFRVQAYPGPTDVQVQVRTGAVRVSQRRALAGGAVATVVVLPNQQAVCSAGGQRLRRELVAQPALLAPQAFVFVDRPVAEVLAALEKAYGVHIEYDAAAVRNCTLNLSLGNQPLFEKLDIICETMGATYEKTGDHLRFYSPACPAE